MPFIKCYTTQQNLIDKSHHWLEDWGNEIKISVNDLNLQWLKVEKEFGAKYTLHVQLLLPDMWTATNIQHLQKTLLKHISKNLEVPIQQIFLTTHLIQSGHIIDGGKEVNW